MNIKKEIARAKDYKVFQKLLKHRQVDPNEFYIFDDRKLAYLNISKVACTAIKLNIGESYGLSRKIDPDLNIHDPKLWNVKYGVLTGECGSYFKFTFVRNPFARLVSCYKNKVLYEESMKEAYYFKDYFFEIPPNIEFSDFVHRVARIPDALADRHFKSQFASVYPNGKNILDFVGRFENLNSDWEKIAHQFNFSTPLRQENSSQVFQGKANKWMSYYDKELAEIVFQRYQKDVLNFGYMDSYIQLIEGYMS